MIEKLESDIAKSRNQIYLIENLDIAPVTEDEWHLICKTPIRYDDVLLEVAKKTFPLGEEFVRNSNDVKFKMNGFNITVPTCNIKGVVIDTYWYDERYLKEFIPSNQHSKMRRYFSLLDGKKCSWYELARCRNTVDDYSTFKLFFWWFFKAKWRKVDRAKWEKAFKEENLLNENMLKKHEEKKREMLDSIDRFKETVSILESWGGVRYVDIFNKGLNKYMVQTKEEI